MVQRELQQMKWFKFYGQDYLSDPKMLSLSASQRSCWITLLAYGSVNDNGKITYIDEQQLMLQSGLDFTCDEWDRTVGILKKLENLKMITVDNGEISIVNWQKRQETNLTSYERVKRYRQKKRNDNGKITLEENRIDKNRREDKNTAKINFAHNKKHFSPKGAEILKAFEEIDVKNKTYYANKTQRAAADFLILEYGFEKTMKLIEQLPKTNKLDYFPTVYSPNDLKEKWGKLIAAMQKYQNNQPLMI